MSGDNDFSAREDCCVEDITYYCQIESCTARKDYLGNGKCIRAIGVLKADYDNLSREEGVETFTLDIDYWHFAVKLLNLESWSDIRPKQRVQIEEMAEKREATPTWYSITTMKCNSGRSYCYKTFSKDPPSFFQLLTITKIDQGHRLVAPNLDQMPDHYDCLGSDSCWSSTLPSVQRVGYEFTTFHVGQGMCSLIHNKTLGILMDIGAGKPVTRKRYLVGLGVNDLKKLIMELESVSLIISHSDSDHWRIIAWDEDLRDKVSTIYVPARVESVAFWDKSLKSKIVYTDDRVLCLGLHVNIQLLRAKPKNTDRNGECLVSIVELEGRFALAPGDYVYERFHTDKNAKIALLHTKKYSAVIVPHHGDEKSGNDVVNSKMSAEKKAIAFFSAGTHEGYNHPTQSSLDAHDSANYTKCWNNTEEDIKMVPLL